MLDGNAQELTGLHVLMKCSLLDTKQIQCAWLINAVEKRVEAGITATDKSSSGYILSTLSGISICALLKAFADPKSIRMSSEAGFHWNGKIYKCVRADDKAIYCREYSTDAASQVGGLVAVRCTLSHTKPSESPILVSSYATGSLAGVVVEATEKFADYLALKRSQ
ncbi:Profilin-4 [Cichlidogyrus casuarinus]|uniref:Profilin-4 n=1 Tax=Cichlidogyrus casuarinus TaxID=1844966 RepID=A0ABD2Q164_9PLAT